MSGETLFLATLAPEFGAPNFFLAFLVGDERSQRSEADKPEAPNERAGDELAAGEARDVIGNQADTACRVTRAQEFNAVDEDFSL